MEQDTAQPSEQIPSEQQPTPEKLPKNNKLTKVLIVLLVITLIGGAYLFYLLQKKDSSNSNGNTNTNDTSQTQQTDDKKIASFDECVAAGNPVMESYPEQCSANGQTFVNDKQKANTGFNTRVNSGKKAFSVIIPDGWSVIKPLDSDSFFVMGTDQPKLKIGTAPKIEELASFGTDAPAVFSMSIVDSVDDGSFMGTSSAITLGESPNQFEGTKYSYTYEKEENPEDVILGEPRQKGDKQYTYVLALPGGRILVATYQVYASDQTDYMKTIEKVLATLE